ncbi:unnamed protein product [Bursaphelenchus xylophilus]|uniref:(pine wood nematode) hypothetical protein n=1 Tax=Bursaphelenchus xylophilus TaxID=6326 RepID=A0A1I7RKC8_BURXY|nr:unnamed protein product [Bursaphelenchus xylophilus]CAG9131379.1 unnamed protein product [Bursaphelenchus xylophilus]
MPDKNEDAENPEIKNKKKEKLFRLDPAFPVTAMSTFLTCGITQMFIYGITGRARLAALCSIITFPISFTMGIMDAEQDFIKWKKTKALREKGIDPRFMPYKVKYDWTNYEDKMYISPERVKLDD